MQPLSSHRRWSNMKTCRTDSKSLKFLTKVVGTNRSALHEFYTSPIGSSLPSASVVRKDAVTTAGRGQAAHVPAPSSSLSNSWPVRSSWSNSYATMLNTKKMR